ncbi:MAG: DUF1398 family protein [Pseudorhodoplanes sp.]
MDAAISHVARECSRASDEGRESFAVIVGKLIEAGVERYHADLVRSEKTFYLPNGESEIVQNEAIGAAPAMSFSAAGVEAAVHAIQAGTIEYKTFCERVLAAGCVGYHVSIAGRRAVYYGRTGDSHVEWFPGQKD